MRISSRLLRAGRSSTLLARLCHVVHQRLGLGHFNLALPIPLAFPFRGDRVIEDILQPRLVGPRVKLIS